MRCVLLFAVLLAPGTVFAWICPTGYYDTGSGCAPDAASVTQGQGQSQGQGQTATGGSQSQTATGGTQSQSAAGGAGGSGGAANNAGNSQSTSSSESFSYPRQTPPAIAGFVQPTASCKNARNGGASSPVAALSLGFSTTDRACDLRETARLAYEMGQPELAVRLLCATEAAKRALGDDCHYTPPLQTIGTTTNTYLLNGQPVTQQQLRDVEKRIEQREAEK